MNQTLNASASKSDQVRAIDSQKKFWKDIVLIATIGIVLNVILIAIPGFYSHDELDWQNRIARNHDPWSFGLASFSHSPFFRPLGTIFISASLRLPLQPFAAHFSDVLLSIATACLVYKAVSLFRPDRALAAAILFMLMPGFAYSVGWVAAGFDLLFTFWGAVFVLLAVQYWRGGPPLALLASLAAFVAALGCKETALSLPICAALVVYIDRDKIDRRRAAILASLTFALLGLYLALRAPLILRMGASGGGGYRFGDSAHLLENIWAYFGFPFAPRIVELQAFPFWDLRQALRISLPHLVLVGLILWRGGPKWALLYLVAFYATLLPVLPISKYETQYTYAGSIVLAIALALLWERRWRVALPVAGLTLLPIVHNLAIQQQMYRIGVCQTRALDTLKATLRETAPGAPMAILIGDDPSWWVLMRAVHDNSFPVRGELVTVTLTREPAAAGMVFHDDCSISLNGP